MFLWAFVRNSITITKTNYTAWVKSHGPSSSRLVFLFKLCSEHVTFVQISILQNTIHIAKQYHNSVLKLARGNKIVTEQKSPLPLLALPFVTIVHNCSRNNCNKGQGEKGKGDFCSVTIFTAGDRRPMWYDSRGTYLKSLAFCWNILPRDRA